MMRLVQLGWQNLHARGTTGRLPLEPVTVLLGPNDAGKTTLLNLPRALLDGPTQGSWPALGRGMYGFEISGVWELDGGSIDVVRGRTAGELGEHYVRINQTRMKVTLADREIHRISGASWPLSVEQLMAGTGRVRMKWLHDHILRLRPWPVEGVKADLAAGGLVWLASRISLDAAASETGQVYCRAVIESLGDLDRENEATIRRLRGAIDTAPARPRDVPPGTVAEWRDKLAALDADIAALERRRGEITATSAVRESRASRIAKIEAQLAKVRSDVSLQGQLEQLDQQRIATELEKATVETAVLALAHAAREKAEAQIVQARAEASAAATDATAMEGMARAAVVLAPLLESVRELVSAMDGDVPWKPLVQAVRDRLAEIEPAAIERAAALDAERAAALVAAIRNPARDAGRAEQDRCRLAMARLQTVEATLRTVQEQRAALERERTAAQAFRDRLGEELAELAAQAEEVAAPDAVSVVDAIVAAAASREAMVRTIDRINDDASDAARLAESREALAKAEGARREIREGLAIAREVQTRWSRRELEDLVEPAAELTLAVLGMPLILLGDCTPFLVDAKGRHIPLTTASHSQRSIAHIALYVALVASLPGWKVIVLDDIEHLQRPRRDALIAFLKKLVQADVLDQVLLAGVDDGWAPDLPAAAVRRLKT
jgi:hypothetical protein